MYAALSPELNTAEEVAAAHAATKLESFKEELAELVVRRLNPIQVERIVAFSFCVCKHMPRRYHISPDLQLAIYKRATTPPTTPNLKTRIAELEADPGYVNVVLASGAQRARACAASTVQRLKDVMGLA